MSTKEKLIEKITSIDDPKVLEDIYRWVSSIVTVASAEKFTEKELNAVREGYDQYKSRDTFTQEEANKVFDEWLKEK